MADEDAQAIAEGGNAGIASFREVVETQKHQVYALALDLTGNHHDAEDLSQEVFIKAYLSIGGFRGDAKLSSWLHRITVNTYIDSRRRRLLKFLPLPDRSGDTGWRPDPHVETRLHGSPERELEASMMERHIEEALRSLSPRERAVFVLRHYHDHPLKEIGEYLKISEGTVKSLLFRAMRRMQKKLAFYRPPVRDQ